MLVLLNYMAPEDRQIDLFVPIMNSRSLYPVVVIYKSCSAFIHIVMGKACDDSLFTCFTIMQHFN